MAFDIRLLDKLSYDDAEPLLGQYIHDLINQFVESDVGQVHVETHPQGGHWIGTFIEMAYLYGEMTPPKMTKRDAQEVMEYILPRKLTLTGPSDTDDAISELVAFWTFLKQDYKLRSAGAIAKYLTSIEDKFPSWMFDPSRGGFAKSFMVQGMQAGHDMMTQEGVAAFQAEYNKQIKNEQIKTDSDAKLPLSQALSMPETPPDIKVMLEHLGVDVPEEGQAVDPATLLGQLMSAVDKLEALEEAEEAGKLEVLETGQEGQVLPSSGFEPEFLRSLRAQSMGITGGLTGDVSLSEEAAALLKSQTITETEPGTILQDFQMLLDRSEAGELTVSGKRQQIPMKLLKKLNQDLCNPITLDLKRPQQQSYPPIHGLYLLLRATGLTKVVAKGKTQQLVLNFEVYDSWRQLNPTERYCTLLEAWLIRGRPEMLGDDRSGYFNEGNFALQGWQSIASRKKTTYDSYADQKSLGTWPRLHNLALMELFGMVRITQAEPDLGKGWRIRSVEALPWGEAVMPLVGRAYVSNGMIWPSETDATAPLNELQPTLKPHFPAWKQSLAMPPRPSFKPGRHVFKVTMARAKRVWRRIAVSGEASLSDLSSLILKSVDFASDHLDQFTYRDEMGRRVEVAHPYMEEGGPSTDEVKIGSLPLSEGSVMEYLFDFGDCWEFEVLLESIESEEPVTQSAGVDGVAKPKKSKRAKKSKTVKRSSRGRRSRKQPGEILESHGEAPPQYPDFDEEW